MSPSSLAKRVLDKFWDGRLPVDPAKIATAMGVGVYANFDLGVSGEYNQDEGRPVIRFNPGEPPRRQRFTIAHEVGHFALSHGAKFRDPSQHFSLANYDPDEVAANRFAAELLMPEDAVRYVFATEGIRTVHGLAEKFAVSEVAMRFRLQTLGYL